MHCKNCETRIENAYNRKEGFWAQVDFKQNRALVRTKRPVSEERTAADCMAGGLFRGQRTAGPPLNARREDVGWIGTCLAI